MLFMLAAFTAKAYLICSTNSLTFSKTEECSAIEQTFASFTGQFYRIGGVYVQNKQKFQQFFSGKHVKFMDVSFGTMI